MLFKGIVTQAIKDNFHILVNNKVIVCSASQKIKMINKIACGDHVEVDLKNNYITNILERKNIINRPKVANVDKVFIVTSFKEPNLATLLLDKMILFYTFHKIKPILVFSKSDLKDDLECNDIVSDYQKAGYKIITTNHNEIDLKVFQDEIKNRVSILAGQSGVGKSTILNQLSPKLNLTTNEISKALKRGKHTTTKTTLFKLFNGLICDTPGFSSIQQLAVKPIELANLFLDFAKYSRECKFNNCIHIEEKICKVKDMVKINILETRYNNYVSIIKGLKGE